MSEKFHSLEELTKLAADKGVELPDEIADDVAGGEYTLEEWLAMTPAERKAAQKRSLAARTLGLPCELDAGVPHP